MKNQRLHYRTLENTAIVLRGGLARAFGSIGLIRFLDEHKLRPDLIVGSSAGGQVAGMYALGVPWEIMLDETANFRMQHISSLWSLITKGQLFHESGINQLFSKFIDPDKTHFDELEQQLAFISTDPTTGEGILINTGEILPAALASNAFPGVINRRTVLSRKLYDGDFSGINAVFQIKKLGYEKVIAVRGRASLQPGLVHQIAGMVWTRYQTKQQKRELKPDFEFNYDASGLGLIEFWKVPELYYQVYLQCQARESEILSALT